MLLRTLWKRTVRRICAFPRAVSTHVLQRSHPHGDQYMHTAPLLDYLLILLGRRQYVAAMEFFHAYKSLLSNRWRLQFSQALIADLHTLVTTAGVEQQLFSLYSAVEPALVDCETIARHSPHLIVAHIIRACAALGPRKLSFAEQVYHSHRGRLRLQDYAPIDAAMIHAYTQCGRPLDVKYTFDRFHQDEFLTGPPQADYASNMQAEQPQFRCTVYEAAISAFRSFGQFDLCAAVLSQYANSPHSRSSLKFQARPVMNAALAAFGEAAQFTAMETLFARMCEKRNRHNDDDISDDGVGEPANQSSEPGVGVGVDQSSYAAMVTAYGHAGLVDRAEAVYAQARQAAQRLSTNPNKPRRSLVVPHAAMMEVYDRYGRYDDVQRVFEMGTAELSQIAPVWPPDVRHRWWPASSLTANPMHEKIKLGNIFIASLAKQRRISTARVVFEEMRKDYETYDADTYHVMMFALWMDGCMTEIEQLVEQMRSHKEGFARPNVATVNFLVSLCASKHLQGSVNKTALFDEMVETATKFSERDQLVPSPQAYAIMMQALARAGDVDGCAKIFSEMQRSHCVLPIHWAALAAAYRHARRLDDVVRVFDESSIHIGLPVPEVIDEVVTTVAQQGYIDKAVEIMTIAQTAGVQPPMRTFRTLLRECSIGSKYDAIVEIIQQMTNKGVALDLVNLQDMVEGLRVLPGEQL